MTVGTVQSTLACSNRGDPNGNWTTVPTITQTSTRTRTWPSVARNCSHLVVPLGPASFPRIWCWAARSRQPDGNGRRLIYRYRAAGLAVDAGKVRSTSKEA